jgi:HAD superfamily hydrolase (TIGR01549 family)
MVWIRPFKVIILDIDNTLIYNLPRPVETLLAFAQEKGLPMRSDALQRGERRSFAYYANGQADEERALFGYTHFRQSYVEALLQAICVTDDIASWLSEAVARLTETPRVAHCPDQVRRVVRMLYEAGYHLVAVSNREGDLRPLLAAHGLSAHFAFALSGGRAGVYKPDPEIFCIAMRTLGVAPAATLAIGDSYDADVVGAQQAGITPVLLDPMGIFPEARCRTIKCLDELIPWLIPSHSDQAR